MPHSGFCFIVFFCTLKYGTYTCFTTTCSHGLKVQRFKYNKAHVLSLIAPMKKHEVRELITARI